MIAIKRPAEPSFFSSAEVKNARERLQQTFEKSERQERFRFETKILMKVKGDLMSMCHNKCAYCESIMGGTSFGDIENFRPKAGARGLNKEYAPMHYWWLAYDWNNLIMSCQICNQKYKRDLFPLENESNRASIGATGQALLSEGALLIDPCNENPDDHLIYLDNGYMGEKTRKGSVTIQVLGLNRIELVNARKKAIQSFIMKLDLIGLSSRTTRTKTKSADLREHVEYINVLLSDHPTQEYAGTLRSIFARWYEKYSKLWDSLIKKYATNEERITSQTKKAVENENVASTISEAEKVEVINQVSGIKRFSIREVEIKNFRSIDHLTMEIPPLDTTEQHESWLLLLGDNGIGKSSILQAVALALMGKHGLQNFNLDVNDYLKHGEDSGFIKVQSYEHDKPVVLHFDTNGFSTDLEESPTFILGYGSTRLLPKGPIQPATQLDNYTNVANLFDYSFSLRDPHHWLSTINDKEFKERVAPAFFDVLALRGDDRLFIEDGRIQIQQYGDVNPLEDNSDGYKTIVALVTDIMQTLSQDSANYHNSQGIVLIDEIGNHLHPRWRMKITSALRRAFPRLQFIVTTHEPLCLRGLDHGEVVVLVRDNDKKIRALGKDLLPDHSMMTIEQLLTSDLFGLINVMDEETEKTYEEFYQLLSKKEEEKTADDKAKIRELSDMISQKQVLGTTIVEQTTYQVINDTFAKKLREEGFKTKEELKKETVDEVTAFLKNKNLDWL